ncbi:MAG: hypothetical protein Q9174_003809 [Haloplaca sp. 1 TL-2023]
MDILGEWLSTTIQRGLGQVLDHVDGISVDASEPSYEDDGSNLRVKVSKRGVVQLIKWVEYKEIHEVWISDSVTKLVATISSTAAAEYERQTGKKVTGALLGNIIQLHDAEIVATHLGPRASRITVFINQFKAIGSDKTNAIGSPRNFDATQEYLQLIEKLSEFRGAIEGPSRSHSVVETLDRSSPAGPRSGTPLVSDDGRYGSQQLLSQLPVPHTGSHPLTTRNGKSLGGLRLPRRLADASGRNLDQGNAIQNEQLLRMMRGKNSKKSATEPADISQSPADQQVCIPSAALNAGSKLTLTGKPVVGQIQQRKRSISPEVPRSTSFRTSPTDMKRQPIRSRDVQISKEQQTLLDQADSWLPAQPGSRGPVAHVPIAILEEISQCVERDAAGKSSGDHLESVQGDTDSPKPSGPECDSDDGEQPENDSDVPISSADWPASSPLAKPRYSLPPDSSPPAVDDSDKSSINDVEESGGNQTPRPTQFGPQEAPLDASKQVTADASLPTMDVADPGQLAAVTCIELSDSDSDFETEEPLYFGQKIHPIEDLASTQEVPATAIQPEEPFLQVKRTPYGDRSILASQTDSLEYDDIARHAPPTKRRRLDSPPSAHRLSQEAHDNNTPVPGMDREVTGPSQPTDRTSNVQSPGIDETVLPPTNKKEFSSKTAQSPMTLHPAEGVPANDYPSSIGDSATNTPQASARGSRRGTLCQREMNSPILSPFVSKRRKLHRSPYTFGFSQDEFPIEDPAITARKYREEFFASRRNSQSVISPKRPETERSREPETERSSRPADAIMQEAAAPEVEEQTYNPRATANADKETQSTAAPPSGDMNLSIAADPPNMEWQSTYADGGSGPLRQPETITVLRQPIVATVEKPDLLLTQDLQSDLHSVSTKLEALSNAEASQQTQRSGQLQSLPELMTPAMSVSDIPRTASPRPNAMTAVDADVYTRFKHHYPEYNGTTEHFHGMCKKIDQLLRADRMEHRSLWDDFIIRHKTDYPAYLQRCVDNVEDSKPYERFYRDEIDAPKFTHRIIQPVTLQEIVPLAVPDSAQPTTLERPDSPKTRVGSARQRRSRSIERSNLHSQRPSYVIPTAKPGHVLDERQGAYYTT